MLRDIGDKPTPDLIAPLLTSAHFRFQTFEEAHRIADCLSYVFPNPRLAFVGISELLINAIEHGNLSISSNEKAALSQQGNWVQEVERRLALPENLNKWAEVTYSKQGKAIKLVITDQGNGFDWRPFQTMDPADQHWLRHHGRGILMAKSLAFDRLDYQDPGNTVICFVTLP